MVMPRSLVMGGGSQLATWVQSLRGTLSGQPGLSIESEKQFNRRSLS